MFCYANRLRLQILRIISIQVSLAWRVDTFFQLHSVIPSLSILFSHSPRCISSHLKGQHIFLLSKRQTYSPHTSAAAAAAATAYRRHPNLILSSIFGFICLLPVTFSVIFHASSRSIASLQSTYTYIGRIYTIRIALKVDSEESMYIGWSVIGAWRAVKWPLYPFVICYFLF